MKIVEIENCSRTLAEPLYAEYCQSFWCKFAGLSFRRRIPLNHALILVQSRPSRIDSAIHMIGMFFDLAVLWLDDDLRVLEVRHARRWWSIIVPRHPARYVVECPQSRLDEFSIGDQLAFQDPPKN
jgi:uncharacterized membrane protein (UPF0127 family)